LDPKKLNNANIISEITDMFDFVVFYKLQICTEKILGKPISGIFVSSFGPCDPKITTFQTERTMNTNALSIKPILLVAWMSNKHACPPTRIQA